MSLLVLISAFFGIFVDAQIQVVLMYYNQIYYSDLTKILSQYSGSSQSLSIGRGGAVNDLTIIEGNSTES